MSNAVKMRGFTLIELLVAIAIVALLAAIAVPSYSSFITKGSIRTAVADVKALSLNVENKYQKTLSYSDLTATSVVATEFPGWKQASTVFNITVVSSATNSTYTITAAGNTAGYTNCKVILDQAGSCAISGCSALNGTC